MLEERDEGFSLTAEMVEQPGEREDGPTSIDVTDKQISIGEVPVAVPQEEKLQEQVQVQQEPKISKRKQKRRITSYLSNISKQVEKNGNQINKIIMMIQSIQKQKQSKSTKGAGAGQSSLQSIKQIQSQVSQLQKQVTRIQNDIQRIRTTSRIGIATKAKFKKLASSSANIKPRSKKGKSLKSTKISRGRKSR
jgi:chromosome segregation ATPase